MRHFHDLTALQEVGIRSPQAVKRDIRILMMNLMVLLVALQEQGVKQARMIPGLGDGLKMIADFGPHVQDGIEPQERNDPVKQQIAQPALPGN